ncbi:MAG: hypothetical protein NVS3B26_23050 [Mycobacteriales bacterium]
MTDTETASDLQSDVDAAARRVEDQVAADPDLVHGDVVEQVALELPLNVAVALCEQSMGFVPDTIRQRLFLAQHEETIRAGAEANAERSAVELKARQRSAKAAATRAATLAKEAAANTEKLKSATCPNCFQVRTPAGTCGCDE